LAGGYQWPRPSTIAKGQARQARDTYNAEPGRPELAAAAANLMAMRKELVRTFQGDPTRQQMLAIRKACMATVADRTLLGEADLQGLNHLAGLPEELEGLIAGFADDQTWLTLGAIDTHWAEIAREQLLLRPDASRDASAQVLLGQQSISLTVDTSHYAAEYLQHMPKFLSPGFKVDSVQFRGPMMEVRMRPHWRPPCRCRAFTTPGGLGHGRSFRQRAERPSVAHGPRHGGAPRCCTEAGRGEAGWADDAGAA
jgi:hypothetical protein